MATSDTNFVYTATGTEGSDFFVNLPSSGWGDDLYFVTASLAGVAANFTVNLPNIAASDRTTTHFRVKTSVAPSSGDKIEFHVYDQSSIVDLRTYGVVVGVDDGATGGTIATANANAISQAFIDHPSNAVFLLPMGKIYVNRDLGGSGIHRFAALRMTSLTDVVLTGWGPGATQLIMTGSQALGTSWIIEVYQCSRVALRDFTISHGPNLSNIDPGLQNHHIVLGSTSATVDTTDVTIENVDFGQCIGDGVSANGNGGAAGNLVNTKVTHITMRTGGHPLSPNGGSRSCIKFISGVVNFELAHFFLKGAKNSPIDCEPSAGNMTGLNIHDGIVDNSGGSTPAAISFDGWNASNPLTNSRMTNVTVLEGQVQVVFTDHCTLDNVAIYASGKAGMAGAGDPLLYVFQQNTTLKLRNIDITRDTGSAAGAVVVIQNTVAAAQGRIEIEGGEWLTRVAPRTSGSDASCHVDFEDTDRLRMRGVRLRIEEATPAGHMGIKIHSGIADLTKLSVEDVVVESPNGLLQNALWIVSQTHNITDVVVRGVIAISAATNGVLFDGITASTMEPLPVLQGCDFSGCTNAWSTDHFGVNSVFPVVGGSKNAICQILGTVAPEGVVTAIQGSRYTFQNGSSTTDFYKLTGTGNTGWTPVSLVQLSPALITGTLNDYNPTGLSTAGFIRQDVATGSPGATLTGLAGGATGRRLTLVNIHSNGSLLLKHENAGSAAANRFNLPGAVDMTMPANGSAVDLTYDGTSSRWRVIAKNF